MVHEGDVVAGEDLDCHSQSNRHLEVEVARADYSVKGKARDTGGTGQRAAQTCGTVGGTSGAGKNSSSSIAKESTALLGDEA